MHSSYGDGDGDGGLQTDDAMKGQMAGPSSVCNGPDVSAVLIRVE